MHYLDDVLTIGGLAAPAIAEQFGTPVYVYDAAIVRRQIDRVRDAFAGLPCRAFYAMKANSNLALLRLIRSANFGCDCVSPGEIHLALRAGYPPDAIWFTCSNVSDEDLRAIPDARIVVNVNSVSEIDRCLAADITNPIALRVNPDVGAGHHRDVVTAGESVKFGIDPAELESARMLVEDSGRRVVGIHAHIGSGVDTPEPLLQSAKKLLEFSRGFPHLRWINFGGGMSIPYKPGEKDFPIARYGNELAHLVGPAMRERGLTAILEPGRYLVAESGTLLARVTSKRISAGIEWIGVDTGFNHLVRPSKYNSYHHMLNASRGSGASLRWSFDADVQRDEVVVAGNICESSDVFTRENGGVATRRIDRVKVGDLLAFCDAGAYGFSMASHYNARLLPPEVLVDDGKATLVRRRQEYEDLFRGME
jgi:diaminopimelate decarboxylase